MIGLIGLPGMASATADEFIRLHPKGQPLPHNYQGPFLTRGDGSILAVDTTGAYISSDEGKTWQRNELFKDSKRFQARGERALIRTRSGAVVFVFLNEAERNRHEDDDAKNPHLPTYVTRSLGDGKTWEEPRPSQWCCLTVPCRRARSTTCPGSRIPTSWPKHRRDLPRRHAPERRGPRSGRREAHACCARCCEQIRRSQFPLLKKR